METHRSTDEQCSLQRRLLSPKSATVIDFDFDVRASLNLQLVVLETTSLMESHRNTIANQSLSKPKTKLLRGIRIPMMVLGVKKEKLRNGERTSL
ncbi:PTS mannose transporter subunit IIA [Sesbania bispinosa]|nr:PTS mannose transporter subunit IIA [Sesbania bispinosa]